MRHITSLSDRYDEYPSYLDHADHRQYAEGLGLYPLLSWYLFSAGIVLLILFL